MANWILFNSIALKPTDTLINLDMVRSIVPGSSANTIALDGILVHGDITQLLLMTNHTVYPGAQGSAITAA